MPVVVPVKFAFAARDLWFDPQDLDIIEGDHAICSTERGTEIGLVTADPFEVAEAELAAPLKPVLRVATDEDLDRADDLADQGDAAMTDFRRLVKKNELDMKPVGVEFLFGGEKAVFYFAAEDRVDFRQLVKDLSSFFHIRVDMRQIGVRDETRLAGGYATCGQELCCTRFGGQFEPVSIRMAKEQDLPLNSSKISGVCGRLMCCLRYEFEAYKDFKGRAPKKKALIDTPLGKAKIQEYDTPREQLVLRLENGKVFRVSLADMTCSDASIKKAEEQHCACRPDCVTRDVLEKIESPEIKLALMELDREHGIDVGDGLDKADRIATSGPTSRRRRGRGGEDGTASGAGSGFGGRAGRAARGARGARADEAEAAAASGAGSSAGRRRRKRGTSVPDETADARRELAADAGRATSAGGRADAPDAAPAPGRRRRRHVAAPDAMGAEDAASSTGSSARARRAAGGAAAAGGSAQHRTAPAQGPSDDQAEAAAPKRRSRRRRHAAAGDAQTEHRKPNVPSVADQLSDGEVRVARRRPGDGGGDRAGRAADAAASGGSDAATEGAAPKRRRRRKPRKPKQDGTAE